MIPFVFFAAAMLCAVLGAIAYQRARYGSAGLYVMGGIGFVVLAIQTLPSAVGS